MKSKKQQILDYRIILKPDKRIGREDRCYVALCPTLGLADDGDTAQEALANIKSTIIFHLDCLKKEHKEIPMKFAKGNFESDFAAMRNYF